MAKARQEWRFCAQSIARFCIWWRILTFRFRVKLQKIGNLCGCSSQTAYIPYNVCEDILHFKKSQTIFSLCDSFYTFFMKYSFVNILVTSREIPVAHLPYKILMMASGTWSETHHGDHQLAKTTSTVPGPRTPQFTLGSTKLSLTKNAVFLY